MRIHVALSIFLWFNFILLSSTQAQNNANDVICSSSITEGLSAPNRIALDKNGNIFVSDYQKQKIYKFSPAGILADSMNVGISPLALAFNASDEMFVSDAADGKIYRTSNGVTGLFYSGCVMPCSMKFGTDGLLYVVDGELKKVIALDISANIVKTIGAGTFIHPSSIEIDERNNRILVGEHGGIGGGMTPVCKVWKYNLNGTLLGSFGSAGNTNGKFYRIQGLAIGKCGNIYVSDPYLGRISVFDENNVFKTTFGTYGDSISQLNIPLDVVFDSQERILVASMNNGALEIYNVLDSLPTSNIVNSNTNICNGSTSDIEIHFTGIPPWTFTYTTNGLNPTQITASDNPFYLTVSDSGLYEITSLTDANDTGLCFTGSAIIRVFNQIPSVSVSDSIYIICAGDTVNIPVAFTGNSPWQFTYTIDGSNSQTIHTANNPYIIKTTLPGSYLLTEISNSGCTGSNLTGNSNVIVNPVPAATFTDGNSSISVCSGDSVILGIELTGTPPWTFNYVIDDKDTTQITTNTTPYSLSASANGTYDVISIYDSLCIGGHGHTYPEVVVNQLPTAHLDSVSSSVCQGNSVVFPVQFTGTSPWALTMLIDSIMTTTVYNIYQNPATLNEYQSGHYQLLSVDDANCHSTLVSGSGNISHYSLPPVNLGQDTILCEGNTIILDAGNSFTYLWSDNSTLQTLSVSQSGIYSATITDSYGCFASDEINITFEPEPIASFTYAANMLEVSFNNLSTNATSYLWDFGDGNSSTLENPVYTYTTPGTYLISLTVSNGTCTNIITQTINVSFVTMSETSGSSFISVYPTPSDGILNIVLNKPFNENVQIIISDMIGKNVYSDIIYNNEQVKQFDLRFLSDGLYTIVISDDKQHYVNKIVINR